MSALRTRRASVALLIVGISLSGCATAKPNATTISDVQSVAPTCSIAAASPWISKWFDAWNLTSTQILRVPDIPPPNIVFYDAKCVYTTSAATVPGPSVDGPRLRGAKLSWRSAEHHDTLTMPNGDRSPVQLMSFTNVERKTGRPFFVMAAPSYWSFKGITGDVTAVFLHEFAHTRQIKGLAAIIGPIDAAWKFKPELDDDAVQHRFSSDSVYVSAYMAERDLLFRAEAADSLADVRAIAAQALAMIRARHARWLVGENAVFAILDDTFLSLEGAGQWTGYAWLAHPSGGGMTKPAAVAKMLGRRRFWAQDEGLGLFLVVDRLMPDWPSLVFSQPSIGAFTLLERAIQK